MTVTSGLQGASIKYIPIFDQDKCCHAGSMSMRDGVVVKKSVVVEEEVSDFLESSILIFSKSYILLFLQH